MIEFVLNLDKNEVELVMHPPFVPETLYKTTVCIQPDPCPGCGKCLLCDSKCTCNAVVTTT